MKVFFYEKRQKSTKIVFFLKRKKLSRDIAIRKQHTMFHRASTNSLSGMRGQKFPSVFLEKTAKIEENSKFQKILENVPRYYHNEAACQISLRYDQ